MKNSCISAIAVAFGLFVSAGSMAQSMSKEQYKSGSNVIAAEHKSAVAACDSLSAIAKDVCRAEASGKAKVEKAELRARYKPSEAANYKVRVARADADYAVASEKCKAGNGKDACVNQAKAAAVSAKADASVQGNGKGPDARKDSASEKRDAGYAVAKEKCDALAGDAKGNCVQQAKARFGKS